MKITQQNKSFLLGNNPFCSQDMILSERIAQKKQAYQKQAMKVVTSAYHAEKKIDGSINRAKEQIQQLQSENDAFHPLLKDIRQQMSQAMEYYQIDPDSQEQKDLELLQKKYDIDVHGSTKPLTEEEQQRLKEMGEMTEYQKLSMDLYGQADYYQTQMQKNQAKMSGEGKAIRQISTARLESHAMTDAMNAKEGILEAASKEAVSMLIDDAKKQIEEKTGQVMEAAKKRKEEEEKEQERIEAAKEGHEKAEASAEGTKENPSDKKLSDITENILEGDKIAQEVNEKMRKILEKEKLLEEDLKGIAVNLEV